jgi:hypothetical protein
MNLPAHTYEEIREVVVDILLKRVTVHYPPEQWGHLRSGVAEVFSRRESKPGQPSLHPDQIRLHGADAELVRDVFWDFVPAGLYYSGSGRCKSSMALVSAQLLRETHFVGAKPYRFHDPTSFLDLVRCEIPDISAEALVYLGEAVSAFYAGCLLASCVMLGVAAEAEFLRLAEAAAQHTTHGPNFVALASRHLIRQKIAKFQDCLKPLLPALPYEATEDLETNFLAIQSVLRIARNDAGRPTGATPQREQVYVYLQLFVPFARQVMRLRQSFA